jgi:hypothetical protein
MRHAIRDARKMRIAYQDGDGRSTERVIQSFAVAYTLERRRSALGTTCAMMFAISAPTRWSAPMCGIDRRQLCVGCFESRFESRELLR